MTTKDTLALSKSAALELLATGDMAVEGLLPGSSNYTFLATISQEARNVLAVYKPSQGETPLWDFAHGTLCQREMAAFVVSETLGWDLVPPTVLRLGPYGRGAVQFFVDADFQQHYFTLQDDPTLQPVFQQIAAFDVVINNADRKSGHCLLDKQRQVWAIDHGVCFHVQYKLRTVIWDFAGLPLPSAIVDALHQLCAQLEAGDGPVGTLFDLLDRHEMQAMHLRASRLAAAGHFPEPDPDRRSYPWPLV